MPIKFQYNKTALQSLNKQLDVRLKALPTLRNKEAALRNSNFWKIFSPLKSLILCRMLDSTTKSTTNKYFW